MNIAPKDLWLPLAILFVLIVTIVAAICCLHPDPSWKGLLINLLTEVIGITIAIGCVDWVVRTHKRKQWQEAKHWILLRLRTFVIASVVRIRVSLGYPGSPDAGVLSAPDYSTEYPQFRKLIEELRTEVKQRIDSLSMQGWASLVENLQDVRQESDTLVTLFGGKLDAPRYKSLLDVNSRASKTVMWCPMAVKSMEESPHWWPVSAMLRGGIAEELEDLLRAIAELGDALTQESVAELECAAA